MRRRQRHRASAPQRPRSAPAHNRLAHQSRSFAHTFRVSQIPIAEAAAPPPTIARGFVPWRLSDAGHRVRGSVDHRRHPKPLYGTYRCQERSRPPFESFCQVIRLHCGTAALLLGCAERSEPRKPRAARRNARAESQYRCRDVQTSCGRYSIYYVDFYFVGSPFIDMRRLAA